jgi:hypothetical protein
MLQANPNLTPNLIKALLQYTAQVYPGYSPLRESAILNTLGAVRLAKPPIRSRVIDADPECGAADHLGQPPPGPHQADANAWKNGVLWERRSLASDGDNIGGTMSDGDNIVWGTADGDSIVTRHGGRWRQHRLGTAGGDNIVWGTDCGGAGCDDVIWGSSDGDNIVWGTASDGDNIVWGTSPTVTTSCGHLRWRQHRVGHLRWRRHGHFPMTTAGRCQVWISSSARRAAGPVRRASSHPFHRRLIAEKMLIDRNSPSTTCASTGCRQVSRSGGGHHGLAPGLPLLTGAGSPPRAASVGCGVLFRC